MKAMLRLLVLLAPLLVSQPALAADEPSCASPREAALSLFVWLQPGTYDPAKAATCLETSPDQAQDAPRLAIQLKSIFDARGLFVKMESLPNTNEVEGEDGALNPAVLFHPELPEVSLEKVGGDWKVAQAGLVMVPAIYQETFSSFSVAFQERLPTVFMRPLWGGGQPWQVLYVLILLLMGGGLGSLLNWLLRGRAHQWVAALGYKMDSEVFNRLRRPTAILGASLLLWAGVPDLHLGVRAAHGLLFLAKTIVSFEVVVIGIRLVDVLGDVGAQRAERTEGRMDDQLVPIIERAAKLVVALLGIVFVFQNMGVDVGSLVAGLGIGGLAFALAAKDALANVFGSLTIFTDRAFQVGDAVEMGGVSGVVEEVGLRSTRVRTFHNSLVTIPNSFVATNRIDNLGKRPYRRTRTTLGILYGTPPEVIQAFVEGIRAIMAANPATVKDSYEVNFYEFGPSSLDILLNFHLEVDGWHGEMTERARIYMEILRLAEELGVGFAFPSQSLYLEGTPDRPYSPPSAAETGSLRATVESFGPGGSRARPEGATISDGFEAG